MIRVLRVHENVMAVMMNTLGRRAQAQSDAQPQAATGQEGEPVTKEKVGTFKKLKLQKSMVFIIVYSICGTIGDLRLLRS